MDYDGEYCNTDKFVGNKILGFFIKHNFIYSQEFFPHTATSKISCYGENPNCKALPNMLICMDITRMNNINNILLGVLPQIRIVTSKPRAGEY